MTKKKKDKTYYLYTLIANITVEIVGKNKEDASSYLVESDTRLSDHVIRNIRVKKREKISKEDAASYLRFQ